MDLYIPSMGDVFVYRNAEDRRRYATVILRGRDAELPPPSVVIDGVRYVFDEFNTDRTHMVMRDHAIRRAESDTPET